MNTRSIMYATLLCSTLSSYTCIAAINDNNTKNNDLNCINQLQNAVPFIENAFNHEQASNPNLVDNVAEILCYYLTIKELIYLQNNKAVLIVTVKTMLNDPKKKLPIDPTLQSIIKKLWAERETFFKAVLSHLTPKTRQLLVENQKEIFAAMEQAIKEYSLA